MTFQLYATVGRSLGNLSDEEVLHLARSGNRPAVEHLLSRYRGLVEGKARSYYLCGAEHDDVIQEGMIGLYKAIRDFQADRLVRFRAFAEICVTRQIISAIKSASRQKHRPLNRYVPLHRPGEEEDTPLLELLIAGPGDDGEASPLNQRLIEYLDNFGTTELSALENAVIRRRLEGKSYQQMALELCCGAKCVDNALQRAKRKIWARIGPPT
jgi:RNA polymerase sporulation-specific sigma factor